MGVRKLKNRVGSRSDGNRPVAIEGAMSVGIEVG